MLVFFVQTAAVVCDLHAGAKHSGSVKMEHAHVGAQEHSHEAPCEGQLLTSEWLNFEVQGGFVSAICAERLSDGFRQVGMGSPDLPRLANFLGLSLLKEVATTIRI